MDWESAAESSIVAACAYDEAAERIHVKLRSGAVWVFEDCNPEVWRLFMANGESKGKFLNSVLLLHPHRQAQD